MNKIINALKEEGYKSLLKKTGENFYKIEKSVIIY
jgi:hypothetical protein